MEIKLPQLAEGVDSATVVNILVSEGARVQKEQSIMELETQKAVGSIPSPEAGTVAKIHVKEGQEVAVGELLISLFEEGGSGVAGKKERSGTPSSETAIDPRRDQPSREEETPAAEEKPWDDFQYESKSGFGPPASPAIRKLAGELGIDLTRVRGSERGGRIALQDVRAYIQRLQELAWGPKGIRAKTEKPVPEDIDFSRWGPIRKERLSPLRRTVGKRMRESWSTIPHITQFAEADISSLLEFKNNQDSSGNRGLTVTSCILKAVVAALKTYPTFNASLNESTEEIVYKDYYHIGIAVDTEAGLIVPVIKDVDKKGLLDLARELAALTQRTRERKVSLDDLQGGTFTVSNQGSIGGGHFTPIVYKPQVAILGLGRSAPRPVAKEGRVQVATILPLSVSYDHRVIDGADAVRFTLEIVQTIEHFHEQNFQM